MKIKKGRSKRGFAAGHLSIRKLLPRVLPCTPQLRSACSKVQLGCPGLVLSIPTRTAGGVKVLGGIIELTNLYWIVSDYG